MSAMARGGDRRLRARVLDANGWNAKREFYYNDAGVQIENLALSTQARIRHRAGPGRLAGRWLPR